MSWVQPLFTARRLTGVCLGLLLLPLFFYSSGSNADDLIVSASVGGEVRGDTDLDVSNPVISCKSDAFNCTYSVISGVENLTLTAVPDLGFEVQSWGGTCAGTLANGPCTINMNGSASNTFSVGVTFVQATVTVAVVGGGTGSVQDDLSGISCPGDCIEDYPLGASFPGPVLTATPSTATDVFTGWQGGGCSGTGTCSPVLIPGTTSVVASFEVDSDLDGLIDPSDSCPNTPQDEISLIDASGCGPSEQDADGDGVPGDAVGGLDQCPNTPAAEVGQVDGNGCGPSQLDDDNDSVTNDLDQCPNTPAAEIGQVDANGCGPSQLDDDNDSVTNDLDQCPNTPATEIGQVDANGCGPSQLDDDNDSVTNDLDQCPNTPAAEVGQVDANGCSPSQLDSDNDGVTDDIDACPGTPAGTQVDEVGCPVTTVPPVVLPDTDRDGVLDILDQCPGTPFGQEVDANGCSASQLDSDNDGINDDVDQCPDTPAGDTVDEVGCSETQEPGDEDGDGVSDAEDRCPGTPAGDPVDEFGCTVDLPDEDSDGVPDEQDQCLGTPAGEAVNAVGCAESQLDDDGDGVNNEIDACPGTSAGEEVDASGCSASQRDSDNDGVNDDVDQCPNTPAGSDPDDDGCADEQLDSDGDGVSDADDSCPNTDPDLPTGPDGCSEVQLFGNELGDLPGLSGNEQTLGSRIDEICPRLIAEEGNGGLTGEQQELRSACSRLKNRNTTEEQAVLALKDISLTELASQQDFARELFSRKNRQSSNRMKVVSSGGGGGVSVLGLNLKAGDQLVSGDVVQSVFQGLLGLGASEDAFSDFGKLGVYVQGDLDFGDRDETELESGYDFDSWNLSIGADYRFSETFFAGLSLGLGETEVDFDNKGGDTEVSSWNLSAYAGWQLSENWYVDGLFSYGQSEFDTTRHIRYTDVLGEFDSTQSGDTDGDQVFLGVNTGYMLSLGGWRFGPTASITYLDGSIDGFTERARGDSSAAWNFIVDDQDVESLRLSAGVQADYVINTSFGVLIPGLRASYVYESEDSGDQIVLRLASNPFAEDDLDSNQIKVSTDDRDSSFFDASLNLSGQFVMGISGYLSYQFYSAYDDYSQDGFTVGLRWDKPF